MVVAKKCKHCGEFFDEAASSPSHLDAEALQRELQEIRRRRKSNELLGLACGLPGIALVAWSAFGDFRALALIGLLLITAGSVFIAKHKGRHPLWGLTGFLFPLGLFLLLGLRDPVAIRIETLKEMLRKSGAPD